MKFSIITISYNQSKYLEKTILSVINQDGIDLEYIVVDAGSTDGSREIINKYSSNIYKIIYESDNGPADGLNKGFKTATGEIFGYINADDILLPGALKKVHKYFIQNKNIDVIYGHSFLIDRNDNRLRKIYSDKFNLIRHAYSYSDIMQPSTFIKSDAFLKTKGFNISNKSNWDAELIVDIAKNNGKFLRVDNFFSCYRIHPNSTTSSKNTENQIDYYRERIFVKIMLREQKLFDSVLRYYYRLLKHIINPLNLIQRIFKGGVYGRQQ
jgi:glycosyltransferase involved in cell wall biosynthesis